MGLEEDSCKWIQIMTLGKDCMMPIDSYTIERISDEDHQLRWMDRTFLLLNSWNLQIPLSVYITHAHIFQKGSERVDCLIA